MMRLRSIRRLIAGGLAVAVVSGCAGIPSSGPVTKVADDGGLGQSAVRYAPARPLPGATPEQIVRGYLDAMLAFPASSRTASAFLTRRAARDWVSSSQVRIYSGPEVGGALDVDGRPSAAEDPSEPVKVRLGFTEAARLDRQGRYARRAVPAALTYTLQQVKGEWRITDPQDGLLVNEKFFTDYFRSFDLYFFDRPGRRLVPDPVYLVVGDQLATTLLTSLAGGPAPDSVESMRTYVPPRTGLRPSVPVSDDGVADVEFTDDLADATDTARDHLSAQVVWTLRQAPGVEGVRLLGGDTALTAGGDEIQPVQAWGGYGPSTARGRTYAVVENRVAEIDDGRIIPISGRWGKNARGAELVAVSQSGVAGVLPGDDAVRVTSRDGSAPLTVGGNDFIEPDWDSDGRLWLVDRAAGGTRVRVVSDQQQVQIAVPGLARLDVTSFKISPDDTRYAVTAGRRMYVGEVVRDVKDQVLGLGLPSRVFTTVSGPRAASWSSPTELSFLGDSQAGVQIYQVQIDGSRTTSEVARSGSLLPDVRARGLAIAQGGTGTLHVSDARRRLWYLPRGGSWRMIDTPPATGLSYGR
ncbi:LpqB family beta-propeller domain-containing protein [Aeromicrobium wangtongii]|uniref:LpqB family beta-propeller domain-containing protein n=1 Tax=Aeromicrobium wangtongii TaxID=2969247 RepID=A0ABY5M9T0_9ACTN|nr:LpqB family beta-propeller domain-containing protein [Aeromicrobium wangtongii]MCD9197071.1 LpqB family beta-propeller domain-containing protein [Aeromicrobium wangtongii]UUP14572.1 LpqB family beta-propeller domain-containing protein [Aeromicrobium wangtongii]